MVELDLDRENNSSATLTHEEILELIQEIKEFEKGVHGFDLDAAELEEFIEVEHEISDEMEFLPVEDEPIEEFTLAEDEKELPEFEEETGIRRILKGKPKKEREIVTTTFKFRINEEGNLVNIDLKTPKPKPESKRRFSLEKLKLKRKGKEKAESEKTEPGEKKSKISKLKGGFGKIGKLKNVIPHRSKKSEEKEEKKDEEE